MLRDLNIPHMGSVENARLIAWRLAEGDTFGPGDVLYEVETDKTTTEVEADEAGVLARQLGAEGDEFKVGDCIGLWAPAGSASGAVAKALAALDEPALPVPSRPAQSAAAIAHQQSDFIRPVPRSAANGVRISPLARRLAAIHEVDVGSLAGSGPRGRITGNDVLAAATRPTEQPAPQPVVRLVAAATPNGESSLVPHSTRRQTIARRMVQSAAIPSLTADMEIDLSALFARRKRESGTSVLGMIAHEAVAVLIANPALNAHWHNDHLLQWHTVHLGIAVDTPEGLVVPVIRNAERLSAKGLTDAIASLGERARAGKLQVADMEGGSFTISNPGALGPVIRAEALLNPPQVALLGLPGIVQVPKAVPDGTGWSLAIRPVVRASLTFDHRALDGGPVIAFLNELKSRIESL